jgi:hypothetical protein
MFNVAQYNFCDIKPRKSKDVVFLFIFYILAFISNSILFIKNITYYF